MSVKVGSRSSAFIESLRQGATFSRALAASGLQMEHGELLLEHLQRSGLLAGPGGTGNQGDITNCASGACSPGVNLAGLSEGQRLHCVGCPLSGI
ncbi:MAG: hypothetical protein SPK50_00740 [Mobiluncus porci]|uniref:hypothetical protein n=1 Tax=Mobiluncus TaxID=2050 RepID=UPI0023F1970A|nr:MULTISPECIES: hypothetical protein [Mobiluncus]MCI6584669.1 hypothetical protein [Mobiluncus sp.]MDD7542025.1 hypothetical protein [Mobiluncus porci]MDY5747647.1 hypothetical protein [Mobiluncus porci]